MYWDFILWLVAFLLQAALLGMTMYTLILCSDLENDFINPHDASQKLNVWVAPEIGVQLFLTVMTLLGRKWLFGPLQLILTAYNMRLVGRKQAFTDVTDIFSQLGREKKVRIYKLIFYLVSFVYCVFRLIFALIAWLDTMPHLAHTPRRDWHSDTHAALHVY